MTLRRTGIATAMFVLPCSGMVYAATWQSAITVPSTVEYDSNPTLATSGEKGVTRYIVAPDARLVGTADQDEFQFGLGLYVVRSSDTAIVTDREDPRLKLGWLRETETGAFGLTARYEESSTLSSTVQETGVVVPDGTQKMSSLEGTWRMALSERSTLNNDIEYRHVTYDINTLTNYDELSNRLGYTYAWSERMELFTRLGFKHYKPDSQVPLVESSNSYTPDVGVNYQFSEKLRGTVYLGVNEESNANSGPSAQGGCHWITAVTARIPGSKPVVTPWPAATAVLSRSTASVVSGATPSMKPAVPALRPPGRTPRARRPTHCATTAPGSVRRSRLFWFARLSYTYKQRQQDGLPDATANVVGLTLTYSYPGF